MSQNIKVFSTGDFPIGKRESHPQPEHRKLVSSTGPTESSGPTNEDRGSYRSPGELHDGISFENLPLISFLWRLLNLRGKPTVIPVGGRPLPANCPKAKNTPATGTSAPSYEETSQKPFMSLPTELRQDEEPLQNKLSHRPKRGG